MSIEYKVLKMVESVEELNSSLLTEASLRENHIRSADINSISISIFMRTIKSN